MNHILDEYASSAAVLCPKCFKVYIVLAEERRVCPHCEKSFTACNNGRYEVTPVDSRLKRHDNPAHTATPLELLRTVGMTTFVEYFTLLNSDISKDQIISRMTHEHDYEYSTANTKTVTGRRIIRECKAAEALNEIVHSSRLDPSIVSRAKSLLDSISH